MNIEHDIKAEKIVRMLTDSRYEFFNIEGSRQSASTSPILIPREEVMAYVMQKREQGAHPNILASLSAG